MNYLIYLSKFGNRSRNRSHTDTAMNCVLLSELPAVKDAAVHYQSLKARFSSASMLEASGGA